ncbi:hypothetical protein QBC42DRAFT_272707 [Cladorrhinum samala]|uniref:Uncharacterized protein n=1 Tax=Cladorrhinum samala TaxID=585594 RepID=A0AAV9HMK2_9PEZI|nr:hypothetical protein QBC42DRAFT_272707 [Cladorrhinum samala]
MTRTTTLTYSTTNTNNTTTFPSSSSSSSPPSYVNSLDISSPPPYQPRSSSSFTPTHTLQIQTPGKPWLSLPLPPRPDPIPIFSLSGGPSPPVPLYTSIRPSRCSGSCSLFAQSSPSSPQSSASRVSSTTYHFGPSNPPRVQLFHPSYSSPSEKEYDSFPLKSTHLLSRTVRFRTRLGTFQWRYASRAERKLENGGAGDRHPSTGCSLILLERVTRISHGNGTTTTTTTTGRSERQEKEEEEVVVVVEEEVRTVVGKFLRSKEYRSQGSSACSAGNGGRLVLDLSKLQDVEEDGLCGGAEQDQEEEGETEKEKEKGKEEEKLDRDMMEVMAVTTCLVMLKKEIDRRRAQQIMIMVGCVGGGA